MMFWLGLACHQGIATDTTTDRPPPAPPTTFPCGDTDATSIAGCIDATRYIEELTALEGPRAPGDPGHAAARARCAERFADAGFTVEFHDYGTGVNVVGVKPGSDPARVLVSAHYDSVPNCDGADDNATGVAGVLELARVLGPLTFQRTLVVACWDEEETGLLGSTAYATRARALNEPIVDTLVFEMIGYADETPGSQALAPGFSVAFPDATQRLDDQGRRGNFITIIGDTSAAAAHQALVRSTERFAVPSLLLEVTPEMLASGLLLDLQRSDHAPFWAQGFPALHLTDTANFRNPFYHCAAGPDAIDSLDLAFAVGVVRATTAATVERLRLP